MKTMICVEHLGYSHKNYELFSSINKIVSKKIEEVCLVPLNASRPFMNINTSVYNVGEMGSFNNGLLICTSLQSVNKILACPTNTSKVLYLYDLEWMFEPMFYEELYNILSNTKVKLIVRSEDFINPIKCIVDREPDAILPSFNLEKLWNLL